MEISHDHLHIGQREQFMIIYESLDGWLQPMHVALCLEGDIFASQKAVYFELICKLLER